MTTENQLDGFHSNTSEVTSPESNRRSPLLVAEKEYEITSYAYFSIVRCWKEYVESFFGTSNLSAVTELESSRRNFVNKSMAYASALLSASNSPLNFLQAYSMLYTLREVICDVEKCGSRHLSPPQKEIMVACLIKLEQGLHHMDANKEYYRAMAVKYTHDVHDDEASSLETRVMTLARASHISMLSPLLKAMYTKEVLDTLSEIYDDPKKIAHLECGWETYVQLARMIFSWKYMFFGLQHIQSKGLHLKSYIFFVRYFYK